MDPEDREASEGQRPRPRVVDRRTAARARSEPAPGPAQPAGGPGGPAQPAEGAAHAPPPPRDAPGPAPEAPERAPRAGPGAAGAPGEEDVWTPERDAQARAVAEEMAKIPAIDWVVNVAATLANVAGAKLQAGDTAGASLAIDALAAIVDATGSRLPGAETPLKQVLADLRLAFARAAGSR